LCPLGGRKPARWAYRRSRGLRDSKARVEGAVLLRPLAGVDRHRERSGGSPGSRLDGHGLSRRRIAHRGVTSVSSAGNLERHSTVLSRGLARRREPSSMVRKSPRSCRRLQKVC
jgi:hypothetical protein